MNYNRITFVAAAYFAVNAEDHCTELYAIATLEQASHSEVYSVYFVFTRADSAPYLIPRHIHSRTVNFESSVNLDPWETRQRLQNVWTEIGRQPEEQIAKQYYNGLKWDLRDGIGFVWLKRDTGGEML
jgi:hypothetical protein